MLHFTSNNSALTDAGEKITFQSESPKILIVLVGLPYSGKTTWANAVGCPIVCPDAVRQAYGVRFEKRLEHQVWATAFTMVSALFNAGHNFVILDACNTSVRRRSKWLRQDNGSFHDWRVVFKVIGTDYDTCINRAILAGDDKILRVITRMAQNFEPLNEDERWFNSEFGEGLETIPHLESQLLRPVMGPTNLDNL